MKQQQQSGIWLLGAFFIAVVVAALAYFFLIAPELDKAASANDDAAIARDANDLLETQILAAQSKEKEVPAWQEEIGKISLDLPATVEQSELERLIYTTLKKYDLPAVDVTYGRPEQVIPTLTEGYDPPTLSSSEEPGTGATPSPSPSPEPSAEPTAAPATDADGNAIPPAPEVPADTGPAFDGLVAIPVTIGTEGDGANVLAFMKEMQTQIDRFYTATNFTITKAGIAEATPGRPALTEDQVTITFSGMVFSLIDPAYSFPGDNDGEVSPYAPGANVPNPFSPLPGTEESEKG
jgi:hypothetical protein